MLDELPVTAVYVLRLMQNSEICAEILLRLTQRTQSVIVVVIVKNKVKDDCGRLLRAVENRNLQSF